jgi:hypothetical protein
MKILIAAFVGWIIGVVGFAAVAGQHTDEWQKVATEIFWRACEGGSVSTLEQGDKIIYFCTPREGEVFKLPELVKP